MGTNLGVGLLIYTKKKSYLRCLVLIVIMFAIYAFDNFSPESIRSGPVVTYICKPIVWLLVACLVLSFPRTKSIGKIRLRSFLRWMTGVFAVAYIFIIMLIGLIEGFGKSPFDHSAFGIITNIIVVSSTLIGRELVRDYFINNGTSTKYFFNIGIVASLMTITNLTLDIVSGLNTKLDIIKYLGENLLPELSNNILASYLVYLGGPILSIIYMGIQQGFYWFFPIMPNLSWTSKALVGTLYPFFSMMLLHYSYQREAKIIINAHSKAENPMGWIVTSIISISVIWFAVGVFPVRPLVIATGSMEPMIYPGDIVLSKRIDIKDLKIGDVIQYKRDNIYIFHRIIDIVEDKKELKYQTKGDNNSIPDPKLVQAKDIQGRVVYTIPKIGWPTLLLKSNILEKEKGNAEF